MNLTSEGLGQSLGMAQRVRDPANKIPTGISRTQTDATYNVNLINLAKTTGIKLESQYRESKYVCKFVHFDHCNFHNDYLFNYR